MEEGKTSVIVSTIKNKEKRNNDSFIKSCSDMFATALFVMAK